MKTTNFKHTRRSSGRFSIWFLMLIPVCGIAAASSLQFLENDSGDYDYGQQTVLPNGFGDAEFTMDLWIRPYETYPIGPTVGQGSNDRLNWAEEDNAPFSSSGWWFQGNFLLDGFRLGGNFEDGTMALQFYGGGRIRWLFGDGTDAGPGKVQSIGVFPASNTPSLLDGQWHHVSVVRRWAGSASADLELWIDGSLIASAQSPTRVNMATAFWDGVVNGGWYWGAEKQAAENTLSTYEDYKGLLDEIRFWSIARSTQDLQNNFGEPVTGSEPGLVGVYSLSEGTGNTTTCNDLTNSQCITLIQMKPGHWSTENAPLTGVDNVAPNPPTNLTAQPL